MTSVTPAAAANDSGTAPPDWSTIDRPVLCPLCDYDLRGLSQPRCPECGYAFDWRELLDPNLAPHPYLFEHHPRRNVRSFFRTLLGSLRPRRFWPSISPTQPISVRRLVLYWLIIATAITFGGAGGRLLGNAYRIASNNYQQRRAMLAQHGNPADPYAVNMMWGAGMKLGPWLDATWPLPQQARFWKQLWQYDSGTWLTMKIMLCAAAWPVLVLLTLNIFTATIKRASIKRSHLFRCAVYSSDAFVLFMLLPLLITTVSSAVRWYGDTSSVVHSLLLLVAVATYHLAVAFRRYLRFPHATATAFAVQFIVLLAVITLLLQDREAWQFVIGVF
jgi:hypothetical protein